MLANLEGVPRAPAQADEVNQRTALTISEFPPRFISPPFSSTAAITTFVLGGSRETGNVRNGADCGFRSVGALRLYESSPTLL